MKCVYTGVANAILKHPRCKRGRVGGVPKKLDGNDFKDFPVQTVLDKSQKFLKVFSDGKGSFSDVLSIP